ncbi:GAF domain-containing protein [Pseudomonas lundensis]|jgi:hypothetical protein|uniref:GAF domain-containing protein n=1 Tax=Pseudomonas lundensis TaxID=86185 RepID=UPI0039F53F20
MINIGKTRKLVYAYSELVYIGTTFIFAFMGWVMGVDGKEPWVKEHPILWRLLEHLQVNSLYIYIGLGALGACAFISRRMGDPWIINKLKTILNGYQKGAFKGDDPVLKDRDRVTIFQHKTNCIFTCHWTADSPLKPWGKNPVLSDYLVPILRSGHISQQSKAAFFASDDPEKSEGVAGRAWAYNRPIVLNDLPNLGPKSPARDRNNYARETFTDVAMVDKYISDGKKLPRSIAAIPFESGGKVWGVVVLDSANPLGVGPDSVTHYSLTVALIGELLEKL